MTTKTFARFTIATFTGMVLLLVMGTAVVPAYGQIYEPEGLNMPGAWNAWTNPPSNNLVLASATQVPGGKLERIDEGTPRYQTMFSVAATGGDLLPGTFEWLFTSGPSTNYYQNKWAAVSVVADSLQEYTKEGATNNSITLLDGKWYTMNWRDTGYVNTWAIFMVTSSEPVEIIMVSTPTSVSPNTPVNIDVGLDKNPSPEEKVMIRYTTDNWTTSACVASTISGSTATAQIPGFATGTVVSYYALTTVKAALVNNFDMYTIRYHNNSGTNYTYTVGGPPPAISFANLQWPANGVTYPTQEFKVYGRVEIPGVTGLPTPAPGVEAWVGYNTANTDPSTWTNWVTATYNLPFWVYDEYVADLGPSLVNTGMYYYATRFRYNTGNFVYGGYSTSGGGFWDGTTNVSGVVDVLTSVGENDLRGLNVWPNPAKEVLSLDLPVASVVSLTDMTGRTLVSQKYTPGFHNINISSFSPGLYNLMVGTGNTVVNRKIVIR